MSNDLSRLMSIAAGIGGQDEPVNRQTGEGYVRRISGTATADSAGGKVRVQLAGGDPIEVPTSVAVKAGQTVSLLVSGGVATAVGVAGWGDEVEGGISAAKSAAEKAQADADAHEEEIAAVKQDVASFKSTAEATYATKTEVDEKTGAITKTLTADYKTWDWTINNISDNYVGISQFNNDVSEAEQFIAQTYAEKTELTEAVNQLSSTMTSNYTAFTDYRKTNDKALSKAQSDATNAQSTIDTYKKSNDQAVADAKAAGTTAQNQLSAYKGTNDQAVADAKAAGTAAQSNLDSYKTATNQRLDELKNIADNAIESWYLEGAPTTSNPPASTWTTDALKKQHSGDMYVDTNTGYSYRWSGTAWVQIKDSDVTKALKEIETVKTTYATKSELSATDTELSGKIGDTLTTAKTYTDSSIETEVTNRNAAIQAKADSISLEVSKTYTKSETFSAYQSDADQRIATANSNASTAKSTAQTAASDAATAKTQSSTAVSTANTASSNASKAVTTANTASSNASAAVSTANGAKTTANQAASTANAAKSTVDGMQIGGRNLVLFSDFSGFDPHGVFTVDGDVATATSSAVGNTNNWQCSLTRTSADYITTVRNKRFTFSMDYLVTEAITYGTTKPFIGAQLWVEYTPDGSTTNKYKYFMWYGDDLFPTAVTSGWVRTSITHTFPDATIVASGFSLYFRDCKGTAKFRHPKLELGNKPTDWTPAPEDIEQTYATSADLKVQADKITAEVSKTYAKASDVSETYATKASLTETASGIRTDVSSTYLSKSDAASTYATSTSLTQTASDLTATISTAQSTADGAAETANATATMIRQYEGGVLVAKTGAAVGALVNANGSFDVVSLTWSDGVPSVSGTPSSFDTDSVNLLGGAARFYVKQWSENPKSREVRINSPDGAVITLGVDDEATNGGLYVIPENSPMGSGMGGEAGCEWPFYADNLHAYELYIKNRSVAWQSASVTLNTSSSLPGAHSASCYVNPGLGLAYLAIDMSFESPGWQPGTGTWVLRLPEALRPTKTVRMYNIIQIYIGGRWGAHLDVHSDGYCYPTWGWQATNIMCATVFPLALLGL